MTALIGLDCTTYTKLRVIGMRGDSAVYPSVSKIRGCIDGTPKVAMYTSSFGVDTSGTDWTINLAPTNIANYGCNQVQFSVYLSGTATTDNLPSADDFIIYAYTE